MEFSSPNYPNNYTKNSDCIQYLEGKRTKFQDTFMFKFHTKFLFEMLFMITEKKRRLANQSLHVYLSRYYF